MKTYTVWYRFGPVGADKQAGERMPLGTAVLKVQSIKAKGYVAWMVEE